MRLIVGLSRFFAAVLLGCACTVIACGNLIGLSGYGVAEGGAANGEGGTGNVAGQLPEGGSAGSELGEGGAEESAGSAGMSGSAGVDGAPSCPGGCDDGTECTVDSCVLGECVHQPAQVGSPCGVARSCDAQAACVRCRDTAIGTGVDSGCTLTAPVCLGTGLDAACTGCSTAADCNDGNECTTETCSAGKCLFTSVAAGAPCASGVCNGSASAEKCVTCADTAAAGTKDAGCSSAKPVCDTSGTPTCYECLSGADCATDNVSCTVETCTNHACSHVATDGKCAVSSDVCKPNKCDATLDCKQVDISSQTSLITTALDSANNGGFESPGPDQSATGWLETGDYYIIYNCSGAGCAGGNGTVLPQASGGGNFVAWMGSKLDSGVTELYRVISFPAGTTKLQLLVDTNFQTKSTAAANQDLFEVRVVDSNQAPLIPALVQLSAANAQTGSAVAWTKDGINVTRDATPLAGKSAFFTFWTSVDTTLRSDFFFDNVRLIATVCK